MDGRVRRSVSGALMVMAAALSATVVGLSASGNAVEATLSGLALCGMLMLAGILIRPTRD